MKPLGMIRIHHLLPLLAALLAFVLVGQALAQDGRPGAPTNVQVAATDTEATITWQAPDAGEGACEPTDYEVWVRKISDGEIIGGSEVTSPWTATGLDPSTDYQVGVHTYSADCDDYSEQHAEAKFSTTASDADNEAEPDEKHTPKRVRRLSAASTAGETDSATITWNAPSTKNGKHHAATDYAVKVISVADNGDRTVVETVDEIAATQVTVDGLTDGGSYRFSVAAYSSECNCWGRWKSVGYTHVSEQEA